MSDAGYYPTIPASPAAWSQKWGERLAYVVKLLASKANCTTDLTLDATGTTTTMTDFRIHPQCVLSFMPTTPDAAAAWPSIYVDPSTITKGEATINHAALGGADQVFRVAILG